MAAAVKGKADYLGFGLKGAGASQMEMIVCRVEIAQPSEVCKARSKMPRFHAQARRYFTCE
jgi:hypothetical protein